MFNPSSFHGFNKRQAKKKIFTANSFIFFNKNKKKGNPCIKRDQLAVPKTMGSTGPGPLYRFLRRPTVAHMVMRRSRRGSHRHGGERHNNIPAADFPAIAVKSC